MRMFTKKVDLISIKLTKLLYNPRWSCATHGGVEIGERPDESDEETQGEVDSTVHLDPLENDQEEVEENADYSYYKSIY